MSRYKRKNTTRSAAEGTQTLRTGFGTREVVNAAASLLVAATRLTGRIGGIDLRAPFQSELLARTLGSMTGGILTSRAVRSALRSVPGFVQHGYSAQVVGRTETGARVSVWHYVGGTQ